MCHEKSPFQIQIGEKIPFQYENYLYRKNLFNDDYPDVIVNNDVDVEVVDDEVVNVDDDIPTKMVLRSECKRNGGCIV